MQYWAVSLLVILAFFWKKLSETVLNGVLNCHVASWQFLKLPRSGRARSQARPQIGSRQIIHLALGLSRWHRGGGQVLDILDLPSAYETIIAFLHLGHYWCSGDDCSFLSFRIILDVCVTYVFFLQWQDFVSFRKSRSACDSLIVLDHCRYYCSSPYFQGHRQTCTVTQEFSNRSVLLSDIADHPYASSSYGALQLQGSLMSFWTLT